MQAQVSLVHGVDGGPPVHRATIPEPHDGSPQMPHEGPEEVSHVDSLKVVGLEAEVQFHMVARGRHGKDWQGRKPVMIVVVSDDGRRPLAGLPMRPGRFIALHGPALGHLTTPAQAPQALPDVGGVIAPLTVPLNHGGNALQAPSFVDEAMGPGLLQQQLPQPRAGLVGRLARIPDTSDAEWHALGRQLAVPAGILMRRLDKLGAPVSNATWGLAAQPEWSHLFMPDGDHGLCGVGR
jgi:hypothetical protein